MAMKKTGKALSKEERDSLLAQDAVVRKAGALMAGVHNQPATLTAWDGSPSVTEGSFASSKAPLAGFSIIEATDLEEVIRLVKDTPCARARVRLRSARS